MTCPSCERQRAKRACPALGRDICPSCCGTKRLTEIACPPTCGYLVSARTHPPAVVVRRRERDFRFLYTLLHKLPEEAYEALGVLHDTVARYRPSAIPPLHDADVSDAAAALASTLETAARGIIYEHQPQSIPAQRLAAELRRALDAWMRGVGQSGKAERWAAEALRRVERGAKAARAELDDGDQAYLDLLDRLPREASAGGGAGDVGPAAGHASSADAPSAPRLILP